VPVSVNETYIYYAPCLFKGAPDEINTARLRRDEGAYGPGRDSSSPTTSRCGRAITRACRRARWSGSS